MNYGSVNYYIKINIDSVKHSLKTKTSEKKNTEKKSGQWRARENFNRKYRYEPVKRHNGMMLNAEHKWGRGCKNNNKH